MESNSIPPRAHGLHEHAVWDPGTKPLSRLGKNMVLPFSDDEASSKAQGQGKGKKKDKGSEGKEKNTGPSVESYDTEKLHDLSTPRYSL